MSKKRIKAPEERKGIQIPTKEPLAPGINPELPLPHQLIDWHNLGDKWFESYIVDFFADLPTHPFEDQRAFAEGALRTLGRLLQKSLFPSFKVIKIREQRRELNLFDSNKLTDLDLGIVTFTAQASLLSNDGKIINEFKQFIAQVRKKRNIKLSISRPAKIINLKRDYIIYLLTRMDWDINSIQRQLAYMDAPPFPKNIDPKIFVRKVRQHFKELEDQVAAPTMDRINRKQSKQNQGKQHPPLNNQQ